MFKIGFSLTQQVGNTVIIDNVSLKTNLEGDPQRFGYPDNGYLERVMDELRDKGYN